VGVTKRTATVEFVLRRHEEVKLGHVCFEQSIAASAFSAGLVALASCSSAVAGVTKVTVANTKLSASGEAFILLSSVICSLNKLFGLAFRRLRKERSSTGASRREDGEQ
jgi:hypothetical protein